MRKNTTTTNTITTTEPAAAAPPTSIRWLHAALSKTDGGLAGDTPLQHVHTCTSTFEESPGDERNEDHRRPAFSLPAFITVFMAVVFPVTFAEAFALAFIALTLA